MKTKTFLKSSSSPYLSSLKTTTHKEQLSWGQNFETSCVYPTNTNSLKIEEKASLPLSIPMLKLRRGIQRLSLLHQKIIDASVNCEVFCLNQVNILNLTCCFLETLSYVHQEILIEKQESCLFKKHILDYAYFISSKKDSFSLEMQQESELFLEKIQQLHLIMKAHADSFKSVWKFISPVIFSELFTIIDQFTQQYVIFSQELVNAHII